MVLIAALAVALLLAPRTEASSAHDSSSATLPPGIVSKAPTVSFSQHVSKINASPAFFQALKEQPEKGPIINLNFLRYRPRGDSSRYNLYGAAAGRAIIGVGGDIVYHGTAIEGNDDTVDPISFDISHDWDGVAYALYPRRMSYIELQEDPAYQAAIPDRVAGAYERMLYVLCDDDSKDRIYKTATSSIAKFYETNTRVAFNEGNVVVSELLRFKSNNGRKEYEAFAQAFAPMLEQIGGQVVLSACAEMPIVSEEYWDYFVAFCFPSIKAMQDLFQSEKFQEISVYRKAGLDASLAVLSTPHNIAPKPTK